MVICKEHCAAGTSVPASIATRQMTIFHLTAPKPGIPGLGVFRWFNLGKPKLNCGAANLTDCDVDGPSGTDVPRRPVSWHSVNLAASRYRP